MDKNIYFTFESYNGGTNNLWIAFDIKTGEKASSLKEKKQAYRNLMRAKRRKGNK